MAQITKLPEELLERIFEHLSFPLGVKIYSGFEQRKSCADYLDAIRNVCSTSKLFHRVAWPILYRAVPYLFSNWLTTGHRGPCYLRTLFSRPESAGALQYIEIRLRSLPVHDPATSSRKDEIAKQQQVVDFFSNFESGQGISSEMQRRLESTDEESIVAIILLICSNVTRVDLHHVCRPDKGELLAGMLRIGAMIRRSDEEIPGILGSIRPRILENLRVINLQTSSYGAWNAHFIEVVMGLPALEELSIADCTNMRTYDLAAPFLPPDVLTFPRISKVRLLFCEGLPYRMAGLLKRCPSLSTLEIDFSFTYQRRTPDPDAHYLYLEAEKKYTKIALFGSILSACAPRVQTLTLGNSKEFCLKQCLQGMDSLRTLAVGVSLVWPLAGLEGRLSEVIPRSIASLRLLSWAYISPLDGPGGATHEHQLEQMSQMDAEVRGFLQDESYRHLESVTFDYHSYKRWVWPDSPSREMEYKRRDVYDEDVARCGWAMTENYGERTQTLERQPSFRS